MLETTPSKVEPGWITYDTRDGEVRIQCDRIIARMGSAPPRKFVEACGIEFTSADRISYPKLSPTFETTNPGIFVIVRLAGIGSASGRGRVGQAGETTVVAGYL